MSGILHGEAAVSVDCNNDLCESFTLKKPNLENIQIVYSEQFFATYKPKRLV